MVFSSFAFLFRFLPVFFFCYFLTPARWKNVVIFAGSLVFYFYGVLEHPAYLLLIVFSILVNYLAALQMERTCTNRQRKLWIFAGMGYNLGSLFVFKYLDFLLENINRIFQLTDIGISLPYMHLVLPIGISFYTFQISSYLLDVYRKQIPAERSVITLGTYLCLFPQLIAGPIVTYSQVRDQLHHRTHSLANAEEGMREFTIGLILKVLIANRVGHIWTQAASIGYENISAPMAWLALLAYTLQIYFDFYGYSLMAKGLGCIMGFSFPDNFRNPYLSRSVSDFWRRWHITLGSWFREYVYIPLGGNRKHHFRNLLIVWLLTGLWHGASWNFVFWGLLSFTLILWEKKGLRKALEKRPLLSHLYTLGFLLFSWLLFATPNLTQTGIYLTRLFPFLSDGSAVVFHGDFRKNLHMTALPLLAGILCCTGLPRKAYEKWKYTLPVTLILAVLFWLCVYCMYLGLDDPFLYYQF